MQTASSSPESPRVTGLRLVPVTHAGRPKCCTGPVKASSIACWSSQPTLRHGTVQFCALAASGSSTREPHWSGATYLPRIGALNGGSTAQIEQSVPSTDLAGPSWRPTALVILTGTIRLPHADNARLLEDVLPPNDASKPVVVTDLATPP
jgi:hypothetical protein